MVSETTTVESRQTKAAWKPAPAEFERIPLASAADDWLKTIPLLLLSLVVTFVVYICSFLWVLQFTGVKKLKAWNKFLIMFIACHAMAVRLMYVKYFTRSEVVFVVYPPKHMWRYVEGIMDSASWFWNEKQMVISNLTWNGRRVGYVCIVPPIHTMMDNPAQVQYVIEYCLHTFKGAKLALAGQLPAVAHQMGLPAILHKDIVNGRVGTVALSRRGAERGLELLQKNHPEKENAKHLKMCVIGGGGFTGKEIAGACSDLFSEIHMFDPKFQDGECDLKVEEGASVTGTFDTSHISRADVVLVFLPKGDLVEPYIRYAHMKQVWIDDTHPPMTEKIRNKLAAKTEVTRLAAYSEKMGMWPKLTGWRPQDLPGCLLTAQVLSLTKANLMAGSSIASAKTGRTGVLEFITLAESIGVELGIFPFEKDEEFKVFGVSVTPLESKKSL